MVPVDPQLVARRRGPARKKDDAEDARILCMLVLDRHQVLRLLIPHGEVAAELRAIARDDERASRDERRLLNRLPKLRGRVEKLARRTDRNALSDRSRAALEAAERVESTHVAYERPDGR